MAGKTVLVTGGVGKATALGLATLGAQLGITGRDRARARTVAADIRAATGNSTVDAYSADLSARAEVRRLAADCWRPRQEASMVVAGLGRSGEQHLG